MNEKYPDREPSILAILSATNSHVSTYESCNYSRKWHAADATRDPSIILITITDVFISVLFFPSPSASTALFFFLSSTILSRNDDVYWLKMEARHFCLLWHRLISQRARIMKLIKNDFCLLLFLPSFSPFLLPPLSFSLCLSRQNPHRLLFAPRFYFRSIIHDRLQNYGACIRLIYRNRP